jgi:hypothetical protein
MPHAAPPTPQRGRSPALSPSEDYPEEPESIILATLVTKDVHIFVVLDRHE